MGIFPNFRGENEKYSKRPPRSIYRYKCHYFFYSNDWSCFFVLEIQVFETFSRFPLWLTSGLSVLCFGSPWETHSLWGIHSIQKFPVKCCHLLPEKKMLHQVEGQNYENLRQTQPENMWVDAAVTKHGSTTAHIDVLSEYKPFKRTTRSKKKALSHHVHSTVWTYVNV